MTYPNTPGHRGPAETSRAAADAIKPKALNIQQMVVYMLDNHGPQTADEIASRLHLSILAVRPRCSELRKRGIIYDSTMRRKNASGIHAVVWRLA